jgi:hypothetical protein
MADFTPLTAGALRQRIRATCIVGRTSSENRTVPVDHELDVLCKIFDNRAGDRFVLVDPPLRY